MEDKPAIPQKSFTTIILGIKKPEDLSKIERQVTFESIMESLNTEPTVRKLKTEDYDNLFDFVCLTVANYMNICYPNLKNLVPVIASDLMEKYQHFKAADFVNCFKWMRQNPQESNLNMNYERILNRISTYDRIREDSLVQFHHRNKGQTKDKPFADDVLKKLPNIGKTNIGLDDNEFNRVQAERERTGKSVEYKSPILDEK